MGCFLDPTCLTEGGTGCNAGGVGASLVGESGQRSGRNRLLVDEGERRRLQEVRRVRHGVQEGQPAAYRGYVLGEQRRQLQGLVRTFARNLAPNGNGNSMLYQLFRSCLASSAGSESANPSPRT